MAVLAVNNTYVTERAGLHIANVTTNDATTNPAAPPLLTGAGNAAQYMNLIGFTPRNINIYVVDTVIGLAGAGANFDGSPVILLGGVVFGFPQVMEHELGHAFVLWHTGNLPGFNWQNVMWPSVSAHFLTEGQTFRMNFHPSSQINAFGLRQGQPTFVCGEPATADCPSNNRRIWPDGSLGPN